MNTIVYNDDNWLFPNQPLKTHDISYDDIQYLLNCANIDDQWAEYNVPITVDTIYFEFPHL